MVIRFSVSSIFAVLVTLALFYMMQSLISGGKNALTEESMGKIVDIVRVKQDQEVQTKQRKAKKPPPPDQPPPDVPPMNLNVAIDNTGFTMDTGIVGPDINIKGGGFGVSDGEYLPIVKVQPRYPQRALTRGQSGWVIVEFVVSAQGTVKDVTVVDNCAWTKSKSNGQCVDSPHSVFDRAAMKAASKFKYKPKVIDGEPIETAGVQNRIVFEIAEG